MACFTENQYLKEYKETAIMIHTHRPISDSLCRPYRATDDGIKTDYGYRRGKGSHVGICNQFGTLIPAAAGLASNADPLIIIFLAYLCGYGPMENSYRGGQWTE